MLLRDLIEVTTSDMVICVNTDEVGFDKDKPYIYCEGNTYMIVKDEEFYPDGIEFEPEFDTLEVETVKSDIYAGDGFKESMIEVYVG